MPSSTAKRPLDVVAIGAGFAGLYMIHRLRGAGRSVTVFEAGADVGGTWYWNRYPGARCDVESMQYSYSFDERLQREWQWTERYAGQPEILRYINHVADRFDLRRDIVFDTRIVSARFRDEDNVWELTTDGGDKVHASYLVTAVGCLSSAQVPAIPGIDDFAGKIYHTGHWPHEGVDFAGLKVGVIGTGSSGIQVIPQIAREAKELVVFQRTPNFSVPAHNRPLSDDEARAWKANYPEYRRIAREEARAGVVVPFPSCSIFDVDDAERERELAERWSVGGTGFAYSYTDLSTSEKANAIVADFVRDRIRETVKDPAVAESLCPKDYPIFTKRICVDTDYYETYNRDNVRLVDLRKDAIVAVAPDGIRTEGGLHELDAIVLATGFDAITGAIANLNIEGLGGVRLNDKWAEGPKAYLGLMSAGFPNLFMITGPGSPSVLSNVVLAIEQHVDWIADCLIAMRERNADRIEARAESDEAWAARVNAIAQGTLYPRAASWYMGANIPGKPRVFMPFLGVPLYRELICQTARKRDPV